MNLAPFDLNLRHLRAAVAAAEKGSINQAAKQIGLSQPAVTQAILKLEAVLSVRLFERSGFGLTLTEKGDVLVERLRRAFDHLANAARQVRRGPRGFRYPDQIMTASQLHALLAIAEGGGFAGAAVHSGLSQPSLHRAVRNLEEICGERLAQRDGRTVGLTVAGKQLARGVRLAANELAAAIAEVCQSPRPDLPIRVGAMPLSRALILPQAIAAFLGENWGADIHIREGSWRELVEPLRDGSLDCLIGALRDPPPAGLEQRPLLEDQLIVVGRADHPLASVHEPTLDQMRAFSWIVGQADTPVRARWAALFAGGDLPGAPLECGSVGVVRGVLRNSYMLTLLSRDQVSQELDSGFLAQIGPALPQGFRTIGVTTRADWRPTAAQQRFLDLLA